MADLVHQHMGDDGGERVLSVAPGVEQGAAVEPDHVGQFAGLGDGAAVGQAAAAEQAEQVEFALGPHLVERLVVGEIDHLDHDALAQAPEPGRKLREGGVGQRLDVGRDSALAARRTRSPACRSWRGAGLSADRIERSDSRGVEPLDQPLGALGERGAHLVGGGRKLRQNAPESFARDGGDDRVLGDARLDLPNHRRVKRAFPDQSARRHASFLVRPGALFRQQNRARMDEVPLFAGLVGVKEKLARLEAAFAGMKTRPAAGPRAAES